MAFSFCLFLLGCWINQSFITPDIETNREEQARWLQFLAERDGPR